jgi:F1F0 ATPase subunit 2
MTMNEPLTFLWTGVAGMLLGAIFFGGLWWTVRRGVHSPRPALWFLGSNLLRMGIALAGFYFVGGGQWQRWLGCLIGFVAARFILLWLTRPQVTHSISLAKEAGHAP